MDAAELLQWAHQSNVVEQATKQTVVCRTIKLDVRPWLCSLNMPLERVLSYS